MRVVVRIFSPLLLLLPLAAFGGGADREPPVFDQDGTDVTSWSDGEADAEDDDAEAAASYADDAISLAPDAPKRAPTRARRPRGGCPNGMSRISDKTCMDRYEAPNRKGAKPLVMQSANDAETWCGVRHKRLCTEDEWIAACEGEEKRQYPYGQAHEESRCNDDKVWRTVSEITLAKWPADEAKSHTKELYQAAASGSKRGCKSEVGVFDLTGNVEEWVTRSQSHANGFRHLLIGCYWSGCYGGGKPTCRSTNNAHGPEFRFYETGFRCCKDAPQRRDH